jgi:phosphonopyruvate decarboxylase
MMSGKELADLLEEQGFDVFTGVPCSLVAGLIGALENHPRLPYVTAVREDLAVGVAGGAWLGRRRPAAIIQNSGLGTALNALASFSLLYRLPLLLVVTWRGYGGADAPEHILMGEISTGLLDLLGVPYRVLSARIDADVAWATETMDARSQPVVLLLPPGVLTEDHGASVSAEGAAPVPPVHCATPADRDRTSPPGDGAVGGAAAGRGPTPASAVEATPEGPPAPTRAVGAPALASRLSRREAVRAALGPLADEPIVHANGYICRESFSLADRPQNFYMIGSMGLAAAIGLGVAEARPNRTVAVFDGDGNLLMSLGILAMIGSRRPRNLVHCVFDNEVYGSTGDQRSPSRDVGLGGVACAAGYRTAATVAAAAEIDAALRIVRDTPGPHFVVIKTTTETTAVPRIPHAPTVIRDRFRASL